MEKEATAEPKTTGEKTRAELEAMYDLVGLFFEGLAEVCHNNEWFHIHPNGTPAYKERYDWVDSFVEGKAMVAKGNHWFKIRPDGTKVGSTLTPERRRQWKQKQEQNY